MSADSTRTLPLPRPRYLRFLLSWHLLYLGSLVVVLALCLLPTGLRLGAGGWGLIGLSAVQGLLYWRTFIREAESNRTQGRLAVYVALSAVIWLVSSRIDERYDWLMLALCGQVTMVLTVRRSLPTVLALLTLFLAERVGLRNLTLANVVPAASPFILWSLMSAYSHHLSTTSAGRADLIDQLERAKAELELSAERDRELATLRERARLARDLHDGLGHTLTALVIQLEAAQRLYRVDSAAASAMMDEMKETARSSMGELRSVLSGLRAPDLEGRSLPDTLQQLAHESAERMGMPVTCRFEGDCSSLPPAVNEAIWRVAQEAVTNAVRHSGGSRVDLSLSAQGRCLRLAVTDDGVGLVHPAASRPGHYGLSGMRERIEGLGGTLVLSNRPGGGTILTAEVPLIGHSQERTATGVSRQ